MPSPLLKSHGLSLIRGASGARTGTGATPGSRSAPQRSSAERPATLPPPPSGSARDPGPLATVRRPREDAGSRTPRSTRPPPRPPPPPLKMVVTERAASVRPPARPPARHMAAPAPNFAGPTASRRPREAPAGAAREGRAASPLTHRPVAQYRDLPRLGLRHLGGLLSPGPTTSTTAATAPAAAIGGGPAEGERHTEQGGGGRGYLSLPRSRAQPPGTDRATAPRPPQHPPRTPRAAGPSAAVALRNLRGSRVRQGDVLL
jgi:hypothetical protein